MMRRAFVVFVALLAACGSGDGDGDTASADARVQTDVSKEDPGPVDTSGWPGPSADGFGADSSLEDGSQALDVAAEPDLPVDPLAGIPSLSPGSATFRPGGVLATFYPGAGLGALPEAGQLELATAIDFTAETGFRARYPKAALTIGLDGGLYVAEPGVYRLVLVVSGTARLAVGDYVIVEVAGVTDVTSFDRKVRLAAGWYPLSLDVERDVLHPHLQLFFGADGAVLEPLRGQLLGYSVEPPATAPPLEATVTLEGHGTRWARLTTTASVPSAVTMAWTGTSSGSQSFPDFVRAQALTIGLDAGGTYALTATFTDLWDRTHTTDAVSVTTPTIPTYTPGGLLGGYYQGGDYKAFATRVAERVDGPIDLPNSLDGNGSGSFRIDMGVDKFAIRWEGGVLIPASGDWTLTFTADDGNRMYLDGELVSDAWYDHGMTPVATTATLPAGWHPITLEMYEQGGAGGATFEWEGPGTPRALVPGDHLGAVRLDAAGPPTAIVTAAQTTGSNALVTVAASELSKLSLMLTADGQLGIPLPESSLTTSYRWEGSVPKGAWTLEVTLTDAGGKTAVVSTPLTMP